MVNYLDINSVKKLPPFKRKKAHFDKTDVLKSSKTITSSVRLENYQISVFISRFVLILLFGYPTQPCARLTQLLY
jgi:hypothetical protein